MLAWVAGRWQIVRELGRGGTGVVFEALDDRLGRVALKVRFESMAALASALRGAVA